MREIIYKQAAIEGLWSLDAELRPSAIIAILNMLNGIPSAQQWIPCSERLPMVREWVLCQCRAGIMEVLRLTEDGDWNKDYPHMEYMKSFVIAWMPLPEAYKGEGHG